MKRRLLRSTPKHQRQTRRPLREGADDQTIVFDNAAVAAVERFERVGYSVLQGQSDWVFAPLDREIQLEMLSGWAAAARDIDDVPLPDVIGWLTRRRDLVVAGRSSIRVGHTDLFARPTATR